MGKKQRKYGHRSLHPYAPYPAQWCCQINCSTTDLEHDPDKEELGANSTNVYKCILQVVP